MSNDMTQQIGSHDLPDTLEESLAQKILDNAETIKKSRPANTPDYCIQCQDLTLDVAEGVARLLKNEADRKKRACQFEGDVKTWLKNPANLMRTIKYAGAVATAVLLYLHGGPSQLPQLPQTPQTPQTVQQVNPQTLENARRLERMENTISNLLQVVQAVKP